MPALSDYLEAALLNATLRGVAFTPPVALYVALYSSDPGDDNSGPELDGVSYPGYARVSIPNANWSAPAAGAGPSQTANTAAIDFPTATAVWPNPVTHFGIFDAATAGNLLFYGPLSAARTLSTGDNLRFAAGALVISLD
jgi:hypothetical protein